MIENEQQYQVTKAAIETFKKAIEDTKAQWLVDPSMKKVFIDAYRSKLKDLRAEIAEYEKRYKLELLIEEQRPFLRDLEGAECRLFYVANYGDAIRIDGVVNAEDFPLALDIARKDRKAMPYRSEWRIYSATGIKLADSKGLAELMNQERLHK